MAKAHFNLEERIKLKAVLRAAETSAVFAAD
jgi:hypothetical protein